MRNIDADTITEEVLSRHRESGNARLVEIFDRLVHHLHDFAREVRLTEDEWFAAIRFLTDCGHITDDKRQEFVLLSDVLGLSMLVTAMNQGRPEHCTEATVLGPFHVAGSKTFPNGADLSNGAPGEPCYVLARILDSEHCPVAGARAEVWQADSEGYYDVQYPDLLEHRARGTFVSDQDGRIGFKSILAEPYPIPHDGPVGKLLAALGRHPWRPAHLHFRITAEGFEPLTTHVFRQGGAYLDSDAVFGVRSSLIADWVRHESGATPNGQFSPTPFYTLEFDFVLARRVVG